MIWRFPSEKRFYGRFDKEKVYTGELKEMTAVLFLYWAPCNAIKDANDAYCAVCRRHTKEPDCDDCFFRMAAECFNKFAHFIALKTHENVEVDMPNLIEADNKNKGDYQWK